MRVKITVFNHTSEIFTGIRLDDNENIFISIEDMPDRSIDYARKLIGKVIEIE